MRTLVRMKKLTCMRNAQCHSAPPLYLHLHHHAWWRHRDDRELFHWCNTAAMQQLSVCRGSIVVCERAKNDAALLHKVLQLETPDQVKGALALRTASKTQTVWNLNALESNTVSPRLVLHLTDLVTYRVS